MLRVFLLLQADFPFSKKDVLCGRLERNENGEIWHEIEEYSKFDYRSMVVKWACFNITPRIDVSTNSKHTDHSANSNKNRLCKRSLKPLSSDLIRGTGLRLRKTKFVWNFWALRWLSHFRVKNVTKTEEREKKNLEIECEDVQSIYVNFVSTSFTKVELFFRTSLISNF